jgi:hypothetical protein
MCSTIRRDFVALAGAFAAFVALARAGLVFLAVDVLGIY